MNLSDHSLLITAIIATQATCLGIGVWWERNRRHGTLHTRDCLHAAVRDRDEARRQVAELSDVITLTRHVGILPRPGEPSRAPVGSARIRPPAAEAHLHVVTGDSA